MCFGCFISYTIHRKRTAPALRILWRAYRCTELHQRLVEIARLAFRDDGIGNLLYFIFDSRTPDVIFDAKEPAQYSNNVTINHSALSLKCYTADGCRSVGPNPF